MGERASTGEEAAAKLFGPAAAWRYRDGFAHAGLAVPGGSTRFISAVINLPAGERAAPLFEPHDGRYQLRPLLRDVDRDLDPGQPMSIPVIVKLPHDVRQESLADFAKVVDTMLDRAYPGRQRGDLGYACLLGEPLAEAAVAEDRLERGPVWTPDPALVARKPVAVMAIIDDGIPFAHRMFRDADGLKTRVEFCWLQGVTPKNVANEIGGYGREYLRDEVNTLIAEHEYDEDKLYHSAGVSSPRYTYGPTIGRFGTHGSHIAGRAAGDGQRHDGDRIRVIIVQLPPATTLDSTGLSMSPQIYAAFYYIFDRAARIESEYGQAGLPLIINFSYGWTGGPHDGSSALAESIRRLLDARGTHTALLLPAGNTFQERLNGQVVLTAQEPRATVPWRIQPNDRTASPLELWFAPGSDVTALAIDVFDPTGFLAASLVPGNLQDLYSRFVIRNNAGEEVGRIYSVATPTRRCVTIELVPTETGSSAPQAAAGLWQIVMRSDRPEELCGSIDCRIHRDFNRFGYFQGARQSYFDPGEDLFAPDGTLKTTDDPDGFLRRFGTLNDLATDAPHTIVVGAGYEDADEPAPYTSAGPTDGTEPAVDCLAPAETNRVLAGRIGAGTRSGAWFRLSGTSVAAPLIASAYAEAYRKGPTKAPGPDAPGPLNEADLGLHRRVGADPIVKARSGRFGYKPKTG